MRKLKEDFIREIIKTVTEEYEFEELNFVKKSSNNSEEVEIKTISKGIFRNPGGHLGIFCKFIKPSELKPALKAYLHNRIPVKHLYEGEKYLLCSTEENIYSFSIEFYKTITKIINEIDFEIPLEKRDMFIGIDKKSNLRVFIIETEIADFAIAVLLRDNPEEEERVILSKKLEESQPFFEFKAPIHFNWDKLIGDKDRQFERICELLLQKEQNISKIIPIGKTRASDRGRDFDVIEKIENLGEITERKWLVQCKYSENSISPSAISGWTDRVIEHDYYGYWLMTNNDMTPNLFDQFKDVEKNEKYGIKIKFWQRSDFYIKLNVNSELFLKNDIFQID
ncbi:MAG: restriction endonuclease [Flavobacterium sp.]|uniref:restriction endonuclease n=1 Tax=Flavobacterium sp. TaxID=239 RepID=UPI0032669C42